MKRLGPCLGLLVLLLAAAPAASAQGRTLKLEAFLHEFDGSLHLLPDETRANVGETLEFTVTNQGFSPHNLVLCGDRSDPRDSTCDDVWARTRDLAANETEVISTLLRKGGTFDYYCSLPRHKEFGMSGTLVVSGDSSDLPKEETPAPPLALVVPLVLALALGIARRRAP